MNIETGRIDYSHIPWPAARLLGSKTGIVRTLLHYLPDRSDPAVFYSTAIESDITELASGDGAGSLEAGGTGIDLLSSRMRTLGEAAERYCLHFPGTAGLIDASHVDLDQSTDRVVPFDYIDVFDPEARDQVGLRRITPTTSIQWQLGTNLLTGNDVYVPAQWIWLAGTGATTRWYPTTSSGSACHGSVQAALSGAITERIERDAVMRTWYRQVTPTAVEIDEESHLHTLDLTRFESAFRRIRFLELESPVDVPVAGCVATDCRDRAPKFVMGGDADPSFSSALQGALLETAQSWAYLKDLVVRNRRREIDPGRIYNLEDNLLYYSFPAQFPHVAFLLEGPVKRYRPDGDEQPSPSARLGRLLRALRQADMTPIAVDVTTRDVEEVGLSVVKVVIPELLDLSLPSLPPVRHPALAGRDITDKPHPYP